MAESETFELTDFTPYLLNLAAEVSSLGFQPHYKGRYGMLRTEWRVLFHLGRFGAMTARDICTRARVHKTKVSRAVAALEAKRFLIRAELANDRRAETLRLTPAGERTYRDLYAAARDFDEAMMAEFTPEERVILKRCLGRIAGL